MYVGMIETRSLKMLLKIFHKNYSKNKTVYEAKLNLTLTIRKVRYLLTMLKISTKLEPYSCCCSKQKIKTKQFSAT